MSRRMIDANTAIFALLDGFCANRNQPLGNAGAPRWIATARRDRDLLINATLSEQLPFSATRRLARFDHRNNTYVCAIGFEYAEGVLGLNEIDTSPGLLTAILAELRPQPRATAAQIIDIVGAADQNSDVNYKGHPADTIASLFPPIKIFTFVRHIRRSTCERLTGIVFVKALLALYRQSTGKFLKLKGRRYFQSLNCILPLSASR